MKKFAILFIFFSLCLVNIDTSDVLPNSNRGEFVNESELRYYIKSNLVIINSSVSITLELF